MIFSIIFSKNQLTIYNIQMKRNIISILVASAMVCACNNQAAQKLPILGARKLIVKTDSKATVDTVYKTIPPFQLVNQDSLTVSNRNFDGKIYVADFFFTSCPDVCPVIQRNMLKVYLKYKKNQQVKLLSYSIDPEHDSAIKLKQYATKLGVEGEQWEFLRGSKQTIYSLAKNDYMVSIDDDTKGPGGFAHEGYLVLVDKEKRMRGVYDGTNEQEVNKLMKDMDILLSEYTK
jgi:protein SCO1